jgi:hypothetical protein
MDVLFFTSVVLKCGTQTHHTQQCINIVYTVRETISKSWTHLEVVTTGVVHFMIYGKQTFLLTFGWYICTLKSHK